MRVENSEKVEQYIKSQDRYRNLKGDTVPLLRIAVDREYTRLLEME